VRQRPAGHEGLLAASGRPEILDSEGWLKTGDIALIQPDGYMRIVDRKKDMILVSGFNVYPNELEDVLATLPGVLQCAAIGVPDEKSGEAIKIFIVAKPGVTLTKEQVMEHMRANVTGYKVPRPWSSAMHCRPPTWQDPASRVAR
jgi:long-chain acyl-CoA synthetase